MMGKGWIVTLLFLAAAYYAGAKFGMPKLNG